VKVFSDKNVEMFNVYIGFALEFQRCLSDFSSIPLSRKESF
jgi:hypothetical protein